MSWQASQWAMAQTAGSGPAKSVLLVLAEAAGPEASCFLSHETIAQRAEVSARCVWAQVNALAKRGLISRERRFDGRGHRTSDLVRLAMPSLTAAGASGGDALAARDASREGALTAPHDMAYSHVVPSLPERRAEEPVLEPVNEPEGNRVRARAAHRPDGFPGTGDVDLAAQLFAEASVHLDAAEEAARFRDHHDARGTRFVSWQAGWRTWTASWVRALRVKGWRSWGLR